MTRYRSVSVFVVLVATVAVGLSAVSSASTGSADNRLSASAAKERLPKVVRQCASRKYKRTNRCRTGRVGKPGRVIGLGKNVGGAGDQYLPFDNGRRVKVSQGNNFRFSHNNEYTRFGWDFAVSAGTTIRATSTGVVSKASGGCPPLTTSTACGGGFGNFVVVRHEDGSCSRYAHLSRLSVSIGQAVGVYAVLGASGNSGYSLGAHLHYQRENCATRKTIASAFIDAGVPATNAFVVSQNRPDAPPAPVPSTPVAPAAPPPAIPAAPPVGSGTSADPPAPVSRVLTVDNRVTNGAGMREDTTPARLTTQPWTFCGRRGCNIDGTERSSGQTYSSAICQTTGERTTNGNDSDPSDDANPARFESTRYYGVRLADARFGYVSEVWIRATDRGGLGLPAC